MLFASTLLLSTLTFLANAQTTTTTADNALSPAAAATTFPTTSVAVPTKVLDSLSKYLTSVTAQPEFSSAYQALTSAIPASILTEIEEDPTDYLSSVLEDGTTPSWLAALPTSYLNYFSSIGAAEESIVSKGSEGPAPTQGPRVKAVGAAMAVGAAGLALL